LVYTTDAVLSSIIKVSSVIILSIILYISSVLYRNVKSVQDKLLLSDVIKSNERILRAIDNDISTLVAVSNNDE
jgi:hypothetical protein